MRSARCSALNGYFVDRRARTLPYYDWQTFFETLSNLKSLKWIDEDRVPVNAVVSGIFIRKNFVLVFCICTFISAVMYWIGYK